MADKKSWSDFVFPAKKVLRKASGEDEPSYKPSYNPSTMDIGKMAQEQADNERAKQFTGAHQPTMEQLKGVGGKNGAKCPHCGK